MNRSHHLLATLVALVLPATAVAQPGQTEPAPPAPAEPAPAPTADDMSAAADAAAAAAAVTPPAEAAPAEAAPAAAPGDEIDLAALGLDPNATQSFDDKLNIYGFADVMYTATHFRGNVPIEDSRSFVSGNLNIYLAKNLTSKWRFLSEVRLMYTPNGSNNPDQTVNVTSGTDPANFDRDVAWGGISIERAYIEYDLHPQLTVRAGHFLTPYGVWNIDHGSPAIISVVRPYMIGEQLFPEHQTGLEFFGKKFFGEHGLEYHLTVSNGRNPVESVRDADRQLAFGGRVSLETPLAGTLKVGVSAYRGRYTNVVTTYGATPDSYDELSYGADVQWDHGGLHVQGEFIGNERAQRDGARARTSAGFAPDGRQWGAYGLLGYRTNVAWNVMPYVNFEYLKSISSDIFKTAPAFNCGLNFRPTPTVVLKAHYFYANPQGGPIGDIPLDGVMTQAAVVF